MKTFLRIIAGLLIVSNFGYLNDLYSQKTQNTKKIIAFLSTKPYAQAEIETRSAFDFLKNSVNDSVVFLTYSGITAYKIPLKNFSLIWIHRPDTVPFTTAESNKTIISSFQNYLRAGGNLLLTLSALKFIVPLGLETEAPYDSLKPCIDEGYGRKLGLHAFKDHPVFAGLNGGAYLLKPVRDIKTWITGYFGDHLPKNGKVVAVDWDYIFLREQSKLMIEYSTGKGKVLAVGGYMWFSEPNFNRANLVLFTKNLIKYLCSENLQGKKYYWDYSPAKVIPFRVENLTDSSVESNRRPSGKNEWKPEDDPLTISKENASGNYWDVAGERILTMGEEKGGIEEVWTHPFMALRDFRTGILFNGQDSVTWLSSMKPEIKVRPSSFERYYKFQGTEIREYIVNDPAIPCGVIHYDYRGEKSCELVIEFKTNLRLMWPYSEKVTGSLLYGWDSLAGACMIKNKSGDMTAMIGGNRKPVEYKAGQYSGFIFDKNNRSFNGLQGKPIQVCCLIRYKFNRDDLLDIIFSGTSEGEKVCRDFYFSALRDPYKLFENAKKHWLNLVNDKLVITSTDRNFNKGYLWSMIAADRFFVNTPGMGKSLVAGYSTTKRGWDGGHEVSGRPGYGWYFGRDGEWSGFAFLDIGDFDKVRSLLEMYNKYQDLNGKIFHEASTSGVIHYDAADATPLYIVLAGRYFRHTNDTAFIRLTWPNIKNALRFCFSTDTDHDRLIENTNVGHGWVEGGELYGSHETLYLNACWAAALTEAAGMARFMRDIEAESYEIEAQEVRDILNTSFWNPGTGFYSYGKNNDDTFRAEPTVLPAVPLYFKIADQEKAKSVLDQLGSNQFSTNWGTRIIREKSPLFNPKGYHYGSVWPLFTGWTSLAEYQYRKPVAGFIHLMENLDIYKNWGLGFAEEVLNGSQYQPSGVCPHQCWSETMVLQPAIEGMLGLNITAPEHRFRFAPDFPAGWDTVTVENIHVGENIVDFRMIRRQDQYEYQFRPVRGRDLKIEFTPFYPAGTTFNKMMLDGMEFPFTAFTIGDAKSINISFRLDSPHVLQIQYDKGISVLPQIPDTKPGDPAEGLRILSSWLSGNKYHIQAENLAGKSDTIGVYIHNQEIAAIENGKVIDKHSDVVTIGIDFPTGTSKYSYQEVIVTLK